MFHPNLAEPTTALLKSQTAEAHAWLESLLLPHLQAVRTASDYGTILKLFYGYFAPLEKELASHIASIDLPDFSQRRKAHFIISDLESIGETVTDLPVANDLPVIRTKAEAFGGMYVMEGSTLGGRGIMRMLMKSLPQLSTASFGFFNGYGESTGPMWIAFQQALNAIATDEAAQGQVVSTANETFLKFGKWIQQTT